MSIERDPVRWSDPSSAEVPDVLRDLMQAGVSDLPSAAKLAALGAKVAATSGGAAATTLGAAKLWMAGVSVGLAVLGGSILYPRLQDANSAQPSAATARQTQETHERLAPGAAPSASARAAHVESETTPKAVTASPAGRPVAAPTTTTPFVEAAGTPVAVELPAGGAAADVESASEPSSSTARGERAKATHAARVRSGHSSGSGARTQTPHRERAASATNQVSTPRSTPPTTTEAEGKPSEVALLLEARRALAKSPHRALELASRHASLFPDSQFAQERDALEIEALTRSGEMERARAAAQRFVRRYPDSAHAHRFREKLGL